MLRTTGSSLAVLGARPAAPPAVADHTASAGVMCSSRTKGRRVRHLRVGGVGIDAAVSSAFLAALAPAGLQACLAAAARLEHGAAAALAQERRGAERARY